MDENMQILLTSYAGFTLTDLIFKLHRLNIIYSEAKKSAVKLKYKKGLMQCSKSDLKTPKYLHLYASLMLCRYSFIPVVSHITSYNMITERDTFFDEYSRLINSIHNEINENEESERQDVAKFISRVYEEFPDALPEYYKGHKLSEATIRISRSEMIKFLKKNKIILEELPTEVEGYVDYNVMLLKK